MAELKHFVNGANEGSIRCSPRHHRRGRIEAASAACNVRTAIPVLHGITAVAELKRCGALVSMAARSVLHGITAVAELKLANTIVSGYAVRVLHGITAVAELKRFILPRSVFV